ncbi:hypothetical protein KCP74_02155 [Salmonella enterica subsp. enterica]|nr:hypothetical protein KCP74_02155 [Salmonella enterica subsp. enterica]
MAIRTTTLNNRRGERMYPDILNRSGGQSHRFVQNATGCRSLGAWENENGEQIRTISVTIFRVIVLTCRALKQKATKPHSGNCWMSGAGAGARR